MMLSFLTLLAQGEAAQQPSGFPNSMIMMVLMIVMFYFLLIRPQQKQRKELEQRVAALQKGDEVITTAGIHALVHNIKERTVVLKIAEGVMVEFDKPAIATVVKKDGAAAK
ncbi:preprotein translocase subunit YajC [Luteolibacter marinus]|uniref:preprotein translocase subunit YajC n=1 Tax=Luteolibacter marinus TaxID=2776705 RepID=UPI001D011D82|nr:preprotein translocase subunit YajC [Luteolibacter marinus]